jgi:hypothetical protein
MAKGLMLGGGALALALIVVLAIRIGRLREQLHDGKALLSEVLRQRDDAVARAKEARQRAGAAEKDLGVALAEIEPLRAAHAALAADLAQARGTIARLAKDAPASLPECMKDLALSTEMFRLLDTAYQASTAELAATRKALSLSELRGDALADSIEDYAEAVRLDDARFEAMRLAERSKRKKRIVGYAFGSLGLLGAGIGTGVGIARR